MNKVLFSLGGVEIKWYAALIVVGAFCAIMLILKEGKRFNISTDFLFNMCFWAIIFGIIGARVYYVVFNLDSYNNFLDMLKIWEGGLAIHGGIIAGLLTVIVYCKKYHVRLLRILDFIAPGLIFAQALGRWGNFFNQEAYGAATTLEHLQSLHIPEFVIKGMNIGGIYYQPTFFYESILCLAGFLFIMVVRRIRFTKIGQPTAIYLLWYGIGRFIIETIRTDSLMWGGFKVAQIVSVVMIILGLGIILISVRKGRYEDLYNQEENQAIRF